MYALCGHQYCVQFDTDTVALNKRGNRPRPGDELFVVGLGSINESGDKPKTLQEGKIEYIDDEICSELYEELTEIDNDSMMCASAKGVDR